MKPRRVVVTGLGALCPLGLNARAFWESLLAGRTSVAPAASIPTEGYRARLGSEIKGFAPRQAEAYALAASREALADASLALPLEAPERAGIVLGTTLGEWLEVQRLLDPALRGEPGPEVWAAAAARSPASVPAAVARALGLGGPNAMATMACAAGNFSLAFGFDRIRSGAADLMLVGGVEVFNPLVFAGFDRIRAIAPERCAPFSRGRQGLIPAEGCGILVLEDEERARRRGARLYGEVLGYGLSSDAAHVTMPDPAGVARAISACLADAGLAPADVDYVSAHGTGTPANDRVETAALKAVFGARAAQVPVSSIKSGLGHAMGAASALEAVACCLALETGWVPPTLNFEPGDPDCDLDYVPGKARKIDPKVVVSNGFAFGGSNAVVALARPGVRTPPSRPARRLVVTGLGRVERGEDALLLAPALLPGLDLGLLDRPVALALAGAKRALDDAGLPLGRFPGPVGIILDSAGEIESQFRFYRDLALEGPLGVEPELFPNILANAAAGRAAIVLGLSLLSGSLAGSFPDGESALACACDYLARAGEGAVLAGGVDAEASLLVLEPLESARGRGARIYAEVVSWREGFEARSAAGTPAAAGRLVAAVRRTASEGVAREHLGRGRWGGWLRLALAPV